MGYLDQDDVPEPSDGDYADADERIKERGCQNCHHGNDDDFAEGPRYQWWTKNETGNIFCVLCHEMHDVDEMAGKVMQERIERGNEPD